MAQKGDQHARVALGLANNPDLFLSAAQIGITLIAIVTGVYSGERFGVYLRPVVEKIDVFRPYAATISTTIIVIIVTFLSIIFGELIPKRLGLRQSERIARLVARPMILFATVTHPIVWLLNKTDQDINLDGWMIADKLKKKDIIQNTVLKATEAIKIKLSGQNAQLSNDGGIITLLNKDGLKIDGVAYTKADASKQGFLITF